MLVLVVCADEDTRKRVVQLAERLHYHSEALSSVGDVRAAHVARAAAMVVADDVGDGARPILAELAQLVGDRKRLPPVLMLVDGDSSGRGSALEAGADDAVSLPFDQAELEARLANQLSTSQRLDQLAAANERLREVERKKRDLAKLVVHDLRNPIAGIMGAAEILSAELKASVVDEDLKWQLLEQIGLLSGKALSHLANILDVEELEEGMLMANLEEVWVPRFIDDLLRPYRPNVTTRGLNLEVNVPAEERAHFDPSLVSRVLENLLDNGVRYARRQGRVAVRVRREHGELVIAVGNDGPPIPEPERTRIFDRYFRVEERRASARENRGLGLYFCRLAAEAHGGTITVGSDPDLPATFYLRLPQNAAAQRSAG